jgi:hypothetical protein
VLIIFKDHIYLYCLFELLLKLMCYHPHGINLPLDIYHSVHKTEYRGVFIVFGLATLSLLMKSSYFENVFGFSGTSLI